MTEVGGLGRFILSSARCEGAIAKDLGRLFPGAFLALSGSQPLQGLFFLLEEHGRGVSHQPFHLQSEEGGFG